MSQTEESADCPPPDRWLVDGYNVLHAGLLGSDREEWWREHRREELIEVSRQFDQAGADIWVVFDGQRPDPVPHAPPPAESSNESEAAEFATAGATVHRVFAPSADDWLVARVRESDAPSRFAVVRADRKVGARVRHHGGRIVQPRQFLERCSRQGGVA